ncbi:bacteriohemerythrin [Thiococcus pfennigii]|jgi:hemerythrin-like metal-binding protein|uniref:bacteriohemerythrin n=1 Tax=Thiococcus pfennigii TaxID=1057 RepID=UPI0019036947|nr:hemerythrin family protein [Thiococcus pfennigii]MBK1732611.1 hypothetical protein [Thiococcus pfennigii]
MVSSLVWLDRWLLGIDTLDADHRALAGRVSRLIEASRDPVDPPPAPGPRSLDDDLAAEQLARLHELTEALRRHFRAEESFLNGIDYPEYPEHMSEHALHLAELVDLARRLEQDRRAGRPQRLDDEQLEFIKCWLVNHIAEDQRFARYYFRQCGTTAAEIHRRIRPTMPPGTHRVVPRAPDWS